MAPRFAEEGTDFWQRDKYAGEFPVRLPPPEMAVKTTLSRGPKVVFAPTQPDHGWVSRRPARLNG